MECALSHKLFEVIISGNNTEYFQLFSNLLSLLNVDYSIILSVLNTQIIAETSDFEQYLIFY